jgi:hypothetical protein
MLLTFSVMAELDKRIVDMTAGELLALIQEGTHPQEVKDEKREVTEGYVYGLAGIAKLFSCSKATAYRMKQRHQLDSAISQIGNLIVVDAEKALKLCNLAKKKK